jgi:hypothetical protein
VTIRSDEELIIALTEMKGPVYKLSVDVLSSGKKEEEKEKTSSAEGNCEGEEHAGKKEIHTETERYSKRNREIFKEKEREIQIEKGERITKRHGDRERDRERERNRERETEREKKE